MKNKKVLVLLLAAAVITGGFAATGTKAYFTSRTSVQQNQAKTGTLILGSDKDEARKFATINFENLQPTNEPYAVAETKLKNVGTLPLKIYRIAGTFPENWTKDLGENAKGQMVHQILDNPGVNIRIDIISNKTETPITTHAYNGMLGKLVQENGVFFNPIYSIDPGETVTMKVYTEIWKDLGNELQDKEAQCDLTVYAEQNNKPNQGEPRGTIVNIGEPAGENKPFSVTAWDDGKNLCFKYDWKRPIQFQAYQEFNILWKKYFSSEQATIAAGLYDIKLYNYDITKTQGAVGTNGEIDLKVSWKLPILGSGSVGDSVEYNVGYFLNGKPLNINPNQVLIDDSNVVKINKDLIPKEFKVENVKCGGINLSEADGNAIAKAFCEERIGKKVERSSIVDIINGVNAKTLIYTDAQQMSLNRGK